MEPFNHSRKGTQVMRKNLFVLLAAALLVVTGCKKDDNTAGNDNGAKMTFTATIDNGGSKTTIDDHDMKWAKGDVININGKDFTADEAGPSTTFTGDEVGKKDGKYMAYYLVTMGEGGSLSLPAFQTYAGVNLADVNPMYAESENLTLTFHNICALIKLDLKGTGSVKTITASANQPLKGTFEILTNQDGGYYAHATSTADADKSVILNCGSEELNGTNAKTFYIALPQGEYTGLKFTLSDGIYTYPIEISGNKELTAGIMYEKEVTGVEFVPTKPEGAFPGLFTVGVDGDGNPRKVYFSKGNLYWDGDSFEIEANQYNYATSWNTNYVTHFYWSSDAAEAYGESNSDITGTGSDVFFTNITGFVANNESGWYTLSQSEWYYLLRSRTNANSLKSYYLSSAIKIENINYKGIFIYPDGYNGNAVGGEGVATWAAINEAGIVFLPYAGRRFVNLQGVVSFSTSDTFEYWSSTPNGAANAYYLYMNQNTPVVSSQRYNGSPVRLVYSAN